MIPYKTYISIDRSLQKAVYMQIIEAFIGLIKKGILEKGNKLPGSRVLAATLGVQRQTVVKAMDELIAQGWLESKQSKGMFVASKLPLYQPIALKGVVDLPTQSFVFNQSKVLDREEIVGSYGFYIDEGIPDVRLAPVETLMKYYKTRFLKPVDRFHSYSDVMGNMELRKALTHYLKENRGLHFDLSNILITRGSQMGMWLACQVLLNSGDVVLVGKNNYISANIAIQYTGAKLIEVDHDEDGIQVDLVEKAIRNQKVKALYLTPHHYHPTTVTMSLERRMELLNLAGHYGVAIIEDDYDYEFHFKSKPILPIASLSDWKNNLYIGSFNKSLAPSIRVGYLIGRTDFIEEVAKLRRVIDRQGDPLMEYAIAKMLQSGEMDRHMRRVLKQYKERRNYFCERAQLELSNLFEFKEPEGGMAIWAKINKVTSIELAKILAQKSVYINNGLMYDHHQEGLNCTRIGFASKSISELAYMVDLLKAI